MIVVAEVVMMMVVFVIRKRKPTSGSDVEKRGEARQGRGNETCGGCPSTV